MFTWSLTLQMKQVWLKILKWFSFLYDTEVFIKISIQQYPTLHKPRHCYKWLVVSVACLFLPIFIAKMFTCWVTNGTFEFCPILHGAAWLTLSNLLVNCVGVGKGHGENPEQQEWCHSLSTATCRTHTESIWTTRPSEEENWWEFQPFSKTSGLSVMSQALQYNII